MKIGTISNSTFEAKKNLPNGMVERIVLVQNPNGVHCRPASSIVRITATAPEHDVYMSKLSNPEEKNLITNSILGIMMLPSPRGTELVLEIPKDYPAKTYKALIKCFEAKNDEEAAAISERYCKNHRNG